MGGLLGIESLAPARLEKRGDISRAVIGYKRKRFDRRHFAGVERSPKFPRFGFLHAGVLLSVLEFIFHALFKRSENNIATFGITLALLVVIQPESAIHSDEYKDQFSDPATQSRERPSRWFGHIATMILWRISMSGATSAAWVLTLEPAEWLE